VLEVDGTQATLGYRPKFLARLMGIVPMVAKPGSGLVVTTSRVRMGWGEFIEFQLPGQRRYTFHATKSQRDEVLACLAEVGFEVSVAESK